ncbi:hypothetical protein [Devosia sp. 2618]|uniref:hypothetical protein n=1 Tax=Devosia sp. 2618 TaxID=3156454 RepID=UPI003395F8BA
MRKLIAAILVAGAALTAGQALAADMPYYPPVIEIPDVNYGVQGSFYLRGSAAGNTLWSREITSQGCPTACGGPTTYRYPTDKLGYGYSLGAGFGYETGTGLRFDATLDYLSNDDASIKKTGNPAVNGVYALKLRSTVALANVYYDFAFGSDYGYGAAGGAFGYVGAGAGVAFNSIDVSSPRANPIASGTNTSIAAAGMVGVGYDFGAVVADIGYRGLYINDISNGAAAPQGFNAKDNWVHEIRTTLRYRFN